MAKKTRSSSKVLSTKKEVVPIEKITPKVGIPDAGTETPPDDAQGDMLSGMCVEWHA